VQKHKQPKSLDAAFATCYLQPPSLLLLSPPFHDLPTSAALIFSSQSDPSVMIARCLRFRCF
jgi:hypothetical protein